MNRGESVESFSVLSRTTERDWDNGSTASSITSTSMAEYTGKLFIFICWNSGRFFYLKFLHAYQDPTYILQLKVLII